MTIDGLADGDVSKWEHFFEMDVTDFLHRVLYTKRKRDEQERQRELEKLKNKR